MKDRAVELLMMEKLACLRLLPRCDVLVLEEALNVSYGHAQALLSSLSIFRQSYDVARQGIYEVHRHPCKLYFKGVYDGTDQLVYFDEQKKIVFGSRYYLTHLHSFLDHIDNTIMDISGFEIEKAVSLGREFVAIEKWFYSYGHFKDECFSLRAYCDLFGSPFAKIILDYPIDDRLDTATFVWNPNYQLIHKLIFGSSAINLYGLGNKLFSIHNLNLVRNGFDYDAFHSFPPSVTSSILDKLQLRGHAQTGKLFVSRSASYRDIRNKQEVENIYRQNGFEIINPEYEDYYFLLSKLSSAAEVVMYYGSAMTNLVYLQPGCRVTIFKSESYKEETLALWDKVIKNYGLNLTVVDAVDNLIDIDICFSKV